MMKLVKQVVFSITFFLISSNIWSAERIGIHKGVLDLKGAKFDKFTEVEFTGDWEFYWDQLIAPGEINDNPNMIVNYIEVPSVWNSHKINGEFLPNNGVASYRLRILADKPYQELAIKVGSIGTAYNLYVNNYLKQKGGYVSKDKHIAECGYKTGIVRFYPISDTTEIIFQVSNYNYSKAGLWNNFGRIGKAKIVERRWQKDLDITLMLVGAMLIFALYHLGLFLLNRNFRYTLYFSLFCLVIVFRSIVVSHVYILHLFPNFNWVALVRIEYLTLIGGTIAFSLFIFKFFEDIYSKLFLKIILASSIIQGLFVLVTSPAIFTPFLFVYQINLLIASAYIIFVVVKAIIQKKPLVLIMLVGFLILMIAIVNDILYTNKVISTAFITPFGFIAFIFSQSYMLSARFSQLFVQTENLAQQLAVTNLNLEKLVDSRTSKIQEQNELLVDQKNQILETYKALEQQNDEIKAQRDNLQKQHEIVQQQKKQITSSINYASRIQRAVFDSANEQSKVVPDGFVLFHAKDIVSGDFYWFKEVELEKRKLKIAAVVDCTGHGVPGAFMSILGAMFLSKVVSELIMDSDASEVLNKMRYEVKNLLNQQSASTIIKDGMDMALVIIDYDNQKMHFAGAHNSIYIIRNIEGKPSSEIEEFKGDKMPIGVFVKEKDSFTNHAIDIHKGDLVYLFSDGYYDQFGGSDGEKLKKINFKNILLNSAHLPLSKQKLVLDQSLFKWRGNFDQIDDITVVGIKI